MKKLWCVFFLLLTSISVYADECKVKLPTGAKMAGVSATWQGGCNSDGYAEGQGSGSIYRKGKLQARYTGSAHDGIPSGRGVVEYIDKQSRYEGAMAGGLPNGQGVKTWKNGERYQGAFKNGERTGYGVYTWKNGAHYEGQFVNGKMEGKGTYISASGRKSSGTWKNNRLISK